VRRTLLYIIAAVLALAFVASDSRANVGHAVAVIRVKLTHEISQAELVARDVDVLHVYRDGTADLSVTAEQLDWIRSTGASVDFYTQAGTAALALDQNLGQYHTYAEMQSLLDSLATAYPALCKIDTLGTTYEGRVVRAIKISDNAHVDENEPEVFIMGCHHAREIMSVEVPLLFAKYLLQHYGSDTLVARLVNTRELWVAPMINPDGHVYVEQNHAGSSNNWWRKNRRPNGDGSYGVDLNRNYSYLWGLDNVGSSPTPSNEVYRGTAAFSEPETRAVRDFCARHHFAEAISYHSYGDLILYDWGYGPYFTIEQELFAALGDTLGRGTGYLVGNVATGAIYVTNGGSDDWMYGDVTTKNKIYSFTVEVNTLGEGGFGPSESLILPTFNAMLNLNLSLLRFADNPNRVLGPRTPGLTSITTLNPPNYSIAWAPGSSNDPNPPVGYELRELKNLSGVIDSCEAGDTLWVSGGFTLSNARAKAGLASFYSGRGDNLNRHLTMRTFYPVRFGFTLSCWLWYNLESNYDYAYLEASTDDGVTWQTVPGNLTTNVNPYGANKGNGITGASSGWVNATFNLGSFLGCEETCGILLRFSCITDEAVNNEGLYVDLVSPTPRCARESVIASGYPATFFHRWPDETGLFTYYVRAFDAEGQASHRSNILEHSVDNLTAAETPPVRSALGRNFPNPFNPTTTIRFSVGLPAGAGPALVPVRLELFDAAGRSVAVLADRPMAPGEYAVSWNGVGARGGRASSGVYFARLTVGDEVFAKKMVVLR
jgi:hypothetical protein